MPNNTLNQYLRFYYYRLKRKDGQPYSPASLICIRAGIQRYMNIILKIPVNIVTNDDFQSANRMLRVKVREFMQSGGDVKQFEPIEEGDLSKIRAYFDR